MGRPLYFCPVVSSIFFLLSIFFSSPNLSGRRLDVYHTPCVEVWYSLVRIWNAGLKWAARNSLEMRDSQNLTTHSVACGDLRLSVVVCGFQTYRSTCRPTIALLWPPYGIGEAIIFLSCGFFYLLLLSFFLAYSQPSQIGCLPYLRMTNYHIGPHRTTSD